MEVKFIKELISEFKGSDLTRLKLNYEGFELELEREKQTVNVAQTAVTVTPVTTEPLLAVGKASGQPDAVVTSLEKHIASPMVGTFYGASSPDSKPFVEVGSKVKKGDVVCIVEAMKLMNEVEADQDGEIVEILVENEDMVEYGQPLFVIK